MSEIILIFVFMKQLKKFSKWLGCHIVLYIAMGPFICIYNLVMQTKKRRLLEKLNYEIDYGFREIFQILTSSNLPTDIFVAESRSLLWIRSCKKRAIDRINKL